MEALGILVVLVLAVVAVGALAALLVPGDELEDAGVFLGPDAAPRVADALPDAQCLMPDASGVPA